MLYLCEGRRPKYERSRDGCILSGDTPISVCGRQTNEHKKIKLPPKPQELRLYYDHIWREEAHGPPGVQGGARESMLGCMPSHGLNHPQNHPLVTQHPVVRILKECPGGIDASKDEQLRNWVVV